MKFTATQWVPADQEETTPEGQEDFCKLQIKISLLTQL